MLLLFLLFLLSSFHHHPPLLSISLTSQPPSHLSLNDSRIMHALMIFFFQFKVIPLKVSLPVHHGPVSLNFLPPGFLLVALAGKASPDHTSQCLAENDTISIRAWWHDCAHNDELTLFGKDKNVRMPPYLSEFTPSPLKSISLMKLILTLKLTPTLTLGVPH